MDNNNKLWVNKYKPTELKDLIGNKSNVDEVVNFLKNWDPYGKQTKENFRAILISGPPGIGKTTAAHLMCKVAGFNPIELNASDTRSKKSIEEVVKELTGSYSILQYFKREGNDKKGEDQKDLKKVNKPALILDEVDGMSAGDRGGVAEVIKLLKTTKIPIICICNDRQSTKVKSLANHCKDIRFRRPTAAQIRPLISKICLKESLKLSDQVLESLVQNSRNDIRQIINLLSTWRLTSSSMSQQQGMDFSKMMQKNTILNPFDIASRYFNGDSYNSDSINDRLDLYFHDYQLAPLMVQENYIYCNPATNSKTIKERELDVLDKIANTSEAISKSDLIERSIQNSQNWELMPMHAAFSCALPAYYMHGKMSGMYRFPSWLGQNSKSNKNSRLLKQAHLHSKVKTSGDKFEFRLFYLTPLLHKLSNSLIKEGTNGISKVINLMDEYYLDKEDWDFIMDIGMNNSSPDKILKSIPSNVKSTFTRMYNKATHPVIVHIPVSFTKGKSQTNAIKADFDEVIDDDMDIVEEEENNEDEEEEGLNDKLISKKEVKPATKRKAAASSTSTTKKKSASTKKGAKK